MLERRRGLRDRDRRGPAAVLTAFKMRPHAQRRFRRGVYLLPGMFTVGNMFCGYACLVYAMRGEYETAAPLIAIAAVLDTFDGLLARMTGASSAFGLQFDSLADVISFGVAPAILTFQWGLVPLGRLGWASGFLFAAAAALRLARYNIQTGSTDKRYFVGVPSPAAALVPAATVFAYPAGLHTYQEALPALAVVVVPGLLMVSSIRYRSLKGIDFGWHRSYLSLFLIATAFAIFAVATEKAEPINLRLVLVGLAYAYIASGLIGALMNRLRRRSATEKTETELTERTENP